MNDITNNIPVHPLYLPPMERGAEVIHGSTLLDYFAGLVMPEIMRQMHSNDYYHCNDKTTMAAIDTAAEYAYKQAAAMLEARKQYIK